VTCDARGAFEARGLERTALMVVAEGERTSSALVEVSLEQVARREDVRLVLDVAGAINGVVVDERDQPIAEIAVNAFPDLMAGADRATLPLRRMMATTTDASGAFTLSGLADGPYRLWASRDASGAGGREGVGAKVGDRDVRLVLPSPGRIVGQLVGPDGKPPALATVTATEQVPVTTRNGRFVVHSVSPGDYELRVTSPDHPEQVVSQITVAAGKDADAGTIQLTRGRRLTGRVVDAQGRPVASARVRAGSALPPYEDDGMMNMGWQIPVSSVTTDASGAFTLANLRPGEPLQIDASHANGRAPVLEVAPGAEDPPPVTLQLRGLGSLSGAITMGGKPAEEVQVFLVSEDTKAQHFAMSGPDGEYGFERLAEGTYTARLSSPSNAAARSTAKATVVAGQRARLNFDLKGGAMSLAVSLAARPGQAVDAAYVYLLRGAVDYPTAKQLFEIGRAHV
jgi:hypothetical protein